MSLINEPCITRIVSLVNGSKGPFTANMIYSAFVGTKVDTEDSDSDKEIISTKKHELKSTTQKVVYVNKQSKEEDSSEEDVPIKQTKNEVKKANQEVTKKVNQQVTKNANQQVTKKANQQVTKKANQEVTKESSSEDSDEEVKKPLAKKQVSVPAKNVIIKKPLIKKAASDSSSEDEPKKAASDSSSEDEPKKQLGKKAVSDSSSEDEPEKTLVKKAVKSEVKESPKTTLAKKVNSEKKETPKAVKTTLKKPTETPKPVKKVTPKSIDISESDSDEDSAPVVKRQLVINTGRSEPKVVPKSNSPKVVPKSNSPNVLPPEDSEESESSTLDVVLEPFDTTLNYLRDPSNNFIYRRNDMGFVLVGKLGTNNEERLLEVTPAEISKELNGKKCIYEYDSSYFVSEVETPASAHSI